MTKTSLAKYTDLLKLYLDDYIPYFEDCVKIRDHNTASVVPFILNRGQKILHNVAEKQKAEKGHVRIIFLKSRRFGGSTYVQARYYKNTSLNFNRNAFIIGHEEDSTSTLFRMTKLMQDENPLKPSTIASNAQELRFDTPKGDGLKSEYRLATARNVNAARSQGIHYLHCSEEAFWPSGADELLTGILQCVPDPPSESEIFRESTANGYGNTFEQAVFDAYCEGRYVYYEENGIPYAWYNPDSDWVLVFIPWFVHERYRKEFESHEKREHFEKKIHEKVFDENNLKWVESESLKLKKKFNLDLEQLYWREWAVPNKCRGSIDKFHQEYPSNVEEAFLSRGSNVFDKELCDELETQCKDPLIIGDLRKVMEKTRIKRNQFGNFSLWEKPQKDEIYFITVDCAGGKKKLSESEKKANREPDKTNIDVWNHRTGNQAAQWNGHISYDLIADLVELIGELYFRGLAIVELNNHGYTVVADLKRKKYPQYEYRDDEPGWMTTKVTKPQMVDDFYKQARDGDLQINSRATVSEMRMFIEENGEYRAASTGKDDRVITGGIASQMMLILPKKFKEMKSRKDFVGFSNFIDQNKKIDPGYKEIYVQ